MPTQTRWVTGLPSSTFAPASPTCESSTAPTFTRFDCIVEETKLSIRITALTKDCSAQVRGYNRAASVARGELLAFSQDDRLPPNSTAWVDAVIGAFRLLPSLAVLGLHRGSSRIFRRSSNVLYGSYLVS